MAMKWTKVTTNEISGEPILFTKTLFSLFGFSINIHKIVTADPPDKFHSHPANAIRIILKGGYVEEVYDTDPRRAFVMLVGESPDLRDWAPGRCGVVTPDFTHRIHALPNGPSWSLWLRGRTQALTYLRGSGWPTWLRNRGVE